MPIGWRKRIKLGPFSINLSKRGLSAGAKVGPVSTEPHSRARSTESHIDKPVIQL
jgi:hypothetical protein